MEEVVQTPSDDSVVVKCYVERDNCGSDADPAQIWRNLSPDTDSSFAETLTDSKFQEYNWHSLHCQHDRVWNKESTCPRKKNKILKNVKSIGCRQERR